MTLIIERLKEVLHYDPITGAMTWLPGTKFAGKPAGAVVHRHNRDYLQIPIDGKKYYSHRLAWFYMTGSWPSCQIDHANRDGLCNAFLNLREATNSQNQANQEKGINNKSGYKGVHFHKGAGRWRAQIKQCEKRIHLGYFDTPELASAAYEKAAKDVNGDFAV